LECEPESVEKNKFLCQPEDRVVAECPEEVEQAVCEFNRCNCAMGYTQANLNCRPDPFFIDYGVELVTNQPISSRTNQSHILNDLIRTGLFDLHIPKKIKIYKNFIGKTHKKLNIVMYYTGT